ncbi:hypothetical protein PG999_008342 [Apiospora kogelbergensis]|uniref:Stc1 domain-containing protein n=1 Tax=Apiospora kogelbergensis TaxID=1337665 RepID=A0AAW0QK98_9PEZI
MLSLRPLKYQRMTSPPGATQDKSKATGEEPPHVIHEAAKPVNNTPFQMGKPPKTDSSDRGKRWCARCDQLKPSSQFHQQQRGRNSELTLTKACLECLTHQARGMRDLAPAVQACPQCRKTHPGTDFLAAVDPEEEHVLATRQGPFKACWGCRLLRVTQWCRECSRVLSKADKVLIALSDDRQLLCHTCSWDVLTESDWQPSPPSPKIPAVRFGMDGSSNGHGNGNRNTSPAPRGSATTTNNSSTRKKRQLPPFTEQNPSAAKKTKFTVAHRDTLVHKVDVTTDLVTGTHPDAVNSASSRGGTSDANKPGLAAPAPEAPEAPAAPVGYSATSTYVIAIENTGATPISTPTAVPAIDFKVQGNSLEASMHIPGPGFNVHRKNALAQDVMGHFWTVARKPAPRILPALHHNAIKLVGSTWLRLPPLNVLGSRFAETLGHLKIDAFGSKEDGKEKGPKAREIRMRELEDGRGK